MLVVYSNPWLSNIVCSLLGLYIISLFYWQERRNINGQLVLLFSKILDWSFAIFFLYNTDLIIGIPLEVSIIKPCSRRSNRRTFSKTHKRFSIHAPKMVFSLKGAVGGCHSYFLNFCSKTVRQYSLELIYLLLIHLSFCLNVLYF